MNLRDLHYLVVIAEEKSFVRAAARCHVSQSTLSIQLKKLEEELGVRLLERSNKNVMLTAIGEEVRRRARHILQQADEIRHLAREYSDPLTGDVTLGAFPTLAPYLFPLCLAQVQKALPRLRLRLVEEKTAALFTQLETGQLDCALVAAPVVQPELRSIVLFNEPFYLAVPESHALASRRSITDQELSETDLLLLDEGHCLRAQALEVCHAIGTGESGRFRATSLETLRQMVAMGDAVTLMPRLALRENDEKIRYIPLKNPAFGRTIALCWRATSARGPLFEKLAAAIRKSVG